MWRRSFFAKIKYILDVVRVQTSKIRTNAEKEVLVLEFLSSGYKLDKKTKTYPIFINYDKMESISDTTKYEDHFLSPNKLIAISKSGRTRTSEDVQNFLYAKQRGIDVQLFVRKNKDDKIRSEERRVGKEC